MKLIKKQDFLAYKKLAVTDFGTTWASKYPSQKWLEAQPEKLFVHDLFYEFALGRRKFKVLDVGGGVTIDTLCFSHIHKYSLIDFGVCKKTLLKDVPAMHEVFCGDWLDFKIGNRKYDYVLSNDLFPNVDQRLGLFLDKFLPCCKTIRMSLTYHQNNRWYAVSRPNGEKLTMLAWDADYLSLVLSKHQSRIISPFIDLRGVQHESIFKNGRSVVFIEFRGDLFNR